MKDEELKRYERQTILPEIGEEGQKLIHEARVLVIGSGGLGSPILMYLTAAGVGALGIVDPDHVDENNLQRQILFGTADYKRPKVEVAAERLRDLNPHVQIRTYAERLDAANAPNIFGLYDIVVDATDNFDATTVINDTAAGAGIPVVYGSVFQYEGKISIFWAGKGPCYRCLYPKPPKYLLFRGAEAGVIGAIPGIIGSIQAYETIKLILWKGGLQRLEPLLGRLLVVDAANMKFTETVVEPKAGCPICDRDPTELIDR